MKHSKTRGMTAGEWHPLSYWKVRHKTRTIEETGSMISKLSASILTAAAPPIVEAPKQTPVLLLEVDIAKPIPCVLFIDLETGQRYTEGLLLVRMYTRPIGMINLKTHDFQIGPHQLATIIWKKLGDQIAAYLAEDGLEPVTSLDAFGLPRGATPRYLQEREAITKGRAPIVSIIVCTKNRPEMLAICLDALQRLDYPGYEIIVVDNAPNDEATANMMHDLYPDISYVREARPGLSNARNRGLTLAVGEITAFTDDDAIVDRHWLAELVRGFQSADNVACVTGLTLPAELETPSQVWLQAQQTGKQKAFSRRRFNREEHRSSNPLYPFRLAMFGAGMNMAFKTKVLRATGGFDPALGIGTPTHSGEDLAAYFEIISNGFTLAYEPGAVVYHTQRDTYEGLRQQMYGSGVGFAAYLMKCFLDNPRLFVKLMWRLPRALFLALRSKRHTGEARDEIIYPLELRMMELRGFVYGPVAYLRSRLRIRRMAH